jgi:hypothetical protein
MPVVVRGRRDGRRCLRLSGNRRRRFDGRRVAGRQSRAGGRACAAGTRSGAAVCGAGAATVREAVVVRAWWPRPTATAMAAAGPSRWSARARIVAPAARPGRRRRGRAGMSGTTISGAGGRERGRSVLREAEVAVNASAAATAEPASEASVLCVS